MQRIDRDKCGAASHEGEESSLDKKPRRPRRRVQRSTSSVFVKTAMFGAFFVAIYFGGMVSVLRSFGKKREKTSRDPGQGGLAIFKWLESGDFTDQTEGSDVLKRPFKTQGPGSAQKASHDSWESPRATQQKEQTQQALRAVQLEQRHLRPGCADANGECSSWASNGECNANPSFMLQGCKVATQPLDVNCIFPRQSCLLCPNSQRRRIIQSAEIGCTPFVLYNPQNFVPIIQESCGLCYVPEIRDSVTLADGKVMMPAIGFGTAGLAAQTEQAVAWAYEAGYRHFDRWCCFQLEHPTWRR